MSNPISHGANALKLENEVVSENSQIADSSNEIDQTNHEYHEELLKNQEVESVVNDSLENEEEKSFTEEALNVSDDTSKAQETSSNGLEHFGVEPDTPDLFSSESDELNTNESFSSNDEKDTDKDEDDLEIPAFLRRQKN